MVWFPAFSQVLSLGIKQDRRTMFQAGVNIPVIFKSDKKYDFTIGADYTSKNPLQPSGLSPQITFVQFISDNKHKNFLISANMQAGYLFDFNKDRGNQFRISPCVYVEYLSFLNGKIGYDYLMSSQKGYPFVSIGLGGFLMLRHLKSM